ncbi:hypothetical protein [Streptacidiphilus sp. EB129]|uniref:hypothetical protein n=1 Tax=Streptacidiphilus sp. EB129 TaxID=3156262 RepID=UPI003518BECF
MAPTSTSKAPAKKAPAKKPTAAPKRPAQPKKPADRPAGGKKRSAKKKTGPLGGARAQRLSQHLKWIRRHPISSLAALGITISLVAGRAARPAARLAAKQARRAALATGEAWRRRKEGKRSALPPKKPSHATCQYCKGTGVIPKHHPDGTFAGSIKCPKRAA